MARRLINNTVTECIANSQVQFTLCMGAPPSYRVYSSPSSSLLRNNAIHFSSQSTTVRHSNFRESRAFASTSTVPYQSSYTHPTSLAEEQRAALKRYPHLKNKQARDDVVKLYFDTIKLYERTRDINSHDPDAMAVPDQDIEAFMILQREMAAAVALLPALAHDRARFEERRDWCIGWEEHMIETQNKIRARDQKNQKKRKETLSYAIGTIIVCAVLVQSIRSMKPDIVRKQSESPS